MVKGEYPGLRLDSKRERKILDKMSEARKEKMYTYPWESLEDDLIESGKSRMPLLGYGSLVNIESASVTLDERSLHKRRPAVSFGVRRIFNYEMPPKTDRYEPAIDNYKAALNVNVTNKIDDVVNGLLIEILIEEIPSIRNRELGYNVVPVATIDWNEHNGSPYLAFILSCPDVPYKGKSYTNNNILPHKHYYNICRSGANEISEEFLNLWLQTTYLADSKTPVSEWENTAFV